MNPKRSLYRRRFTHFTDALIPMYHHLDLVEKRQVVTETARVLKPGGRYVSAEFGPRARNALQRHLAKGESPSGWPPPWLDTQEE